MRKTVRTAVLFGLLVLLLGAAAPARAAFDGDVIGETRHYTIDGEDTLIEVARRFDLGYVELIAANPGVDPWVPDPGQSVVLPSAHVLPNAPREGIVINLAELRLYYFPADGSAPRTHPIGIGQEGWETPLGRTTIARKQADPSWYPPASIRAERPELPAVVPPGPNNPLGRYALYLGWPAYLIHGTNKPYGVGRRVSHGCIRLYPEDIERLFAAVPIGTPVTVVDQPVKAGWRQGQLYLEVHPTQREAIDVEIDGRLAARDHLPDPIGTIVAAAGEETARLDWEAIRGALYERSGVPVRITK